MVLELAKLGIECTLDPFAPWDVCLCMNIRQAHVASAADLRWPVEQPPRRVFPERPRVYYSWDCYPYCAEGGHPDPQARAWWKLFLDDLRRAALVITPSRCQVGRHARTGISEDRIRVVKTSVRPYRENVWDGGYVLDPLRPYPDSCNGWAARACQELGVPCIETRNDTPWGEFKKIVAGARLVVCTKEEASTGGLTLLEAYALGKPVLVSDSPWNGAVDYFGDRATYFRHDSYADFKRLVSILFNDPNAYGHRNGRWDWVAAEYSEARFARDLAEQLQRLA